MSDANTVHPFFTADGHVAESDGEAKYEVVIGLEVHTQLKTNTKMFCNCPNKFGGEPNTHVCPVCLGLPGSLPVANKQAFEYALRTGLALDCKIAPFTKFDRKNYYYPDLPRGYQISQYDLPYAEHGKLEIQLDEESGGYTKTIGITRIHMEDDAGKLVHDESGSGGAGVDLNRAGTPLLEIVTEPELRSPAEARAFMQDIAHILEYLEVSDVNMQEGSLRCDANVSVRLKGSSDLNTRREIKNMNSFRFVEQAVTEEIKNQINMVETGKTIVQSTCLFNSQTGEVRPMRSKEDAQDYRYFPEPDLPPMTITTERLDEARHGVCELPKARKQRYIAELELSDYDAGVLTAAKGRADIFEELLSSGLKPKAAANWLTIDLQAALKDQGLTPESCGIAPADIVALVKLVQAGTINRATAKDKVWPEMLETKKSAETIVKEKGYAQVSDTGAIAEIITKIINDNPKQLEDFKNGKDAVKNWFFGQCMRQLKGQGRPDVIRAELEKLLNEAKG